MTHAFFKALLFLGSGAVIHAMHQALHHTHSEWDAQDMRNMGGLRKHMPITWMTMWVATLAISGVWPFAGFFSKDEIIWQAGAARGRPVRRLVHRLLDPGAGRRAPDRVLHDPPDGHDLPRPEPLPAEEREHLHEAPAVMWVPLVVLAVLSVVGGWLNVPEDDPPAFRFWAGSPPREWVHDWLHPVTAPGRRDLRAAQLGEPLQTAPVGGGEGFWAIASFAWRSR